MQRIDAIVRPERLEAVKQSLLGLGHNGLTVSEVKGHGTQKGITQHWRGEEYVIDLLPKIMLTAVVHEDEVEPCLDAIVKAGHTGNIGDGKVFVSPVTEVVRIRTGERGEAAL